MRFRGEIPGTLVTFCEAELDLHPRARVVPGLRVFGVEISRIQRANHTVSGGVSILYAFRPFVENTALLDSADRLVCAEGRDWVMAITGSLGYY